MRISHWLGNSYLDIESTYVLHNFRHLSFNFVLKNPSPFLQNTTKCLPTWLDDRFQFHLTVKTSTIALISFLTIEPNFSFSQSYILTENKYRWWLISKPTYFFIYDISYSLIFLAYRHYQHTISYPLWNMLPCKNLWLKKRGLPKLGWNSMYLAWLDRSRTKSVL